MPSQFVALKNPSTFRKVAAAMWKRSNDPAIYGSMLVEMTNAQRYLDSLRETSGAKVTVTHLVTRAVALALKKHPDLNAKVRWWGRIMLRKSVNVFVQVTTDGGRDLSGALIERADEKTVLDLAGELRQKADMVRKGRDASYEKSRGFFARLPWWLVRPFLKLASFLTNELHFDLAKMGMPRDPFGSAMVTSVGMFGVDTAFAPLAPIARCPILILITEVKPRPWVEDGQVVVRPVLQLCATFDHRILDGFHAAMLGSTVKELLSDPARQMDPLPANHS